MQIETVPPAMACRYCPSLDNNVVFLKKETETGYPENICLCAHLCEKDKRMLCPYHNERTKVGRYDF